MNIPQIEEVNMFREDGMVIHFTNPKGVFALQHRFLPFSKFTRVLVASYSCQFVRCGDRSGRDEREVCS